MKSNEIFLAFQRKSKEFMPKTNIVAPKKNDSPFKKLLNENLIERDDVNLKANNKESGKTTFFRTKQILEQSKNSSDVDVVKDEEMQGNSVYAQYIQFISSILENADSGELDFKLNDSTTSSLEELKNLLTQLTSKEGSIDLNEHTSFDKIVASLNNLVNNMENRENNTAENIVELKNLLEEIKNQTNIEPRRDEIKAINPPQHYDNNQNKKSILQERTQEATTDEFILLDEEQNLEDKIDSNFNTKFNFEKEKSGLEYEVKNTVLKNPTTEIVVNPIKINPLIEETATEDGIVFQDLKSGNSYIIENKNELPIQKQVFNNILDQVEKAHIHVRESDSEIHLQLKPDNLGTLTMKIAIEKGIVVAKIVAENQVVKEVLETNFNQLKDSLNQKGFGVQELSVSVGQDSNFRDRNSFAQFRKFKNTRINNDFTGIQNSALSTLNNPSRGATSSIDFFA